MADHALSIVIPTYQRAELLPQAIDTALAQTVPCEVLVVDHGSADATPEVAAGYGDAIRYVRREVDDGPFVAWLDGVLQATGDLVHLTYDDDWLAPTFAERCVEAMADDVALAFTNAEIHFPDRHELMLDPTDARLTTGESDSLVRYLLGSDLTLSPGCMVLRRTDALQALMTNPVARRNPYHGAGPDLMMYLHPLLRYPRAVFVPEPLAMFRAHPGSITVDALGDPEKHRGLRDAYTDYKRFVIEAFSGG